MKPWEHVHRHLQSCVGTRARLGYAVFDAQLWKAYFVTTLYAIRTLCMLMPYAGDHVSSRPWYQYAWFEITPGMPGPAGAYEHVPLILFLQVLPCSRPLLQANNHSGNTACEGGMHRSETGTIDFGSLWILNQYTVFHWLPFGQGLCMADKSCSWFNYPLTWYWTTTNNDGTHLVFKIIYIVNNSTSTNRA